MNRPAVKAGLIGGVAAIVVSLLGLIPAAVCACFSLPLEWLAFAVAGVLAAAWLTPPRQSGLGAREGAIAGAIAGLVTGVCGMILTPISLARSGGAAQYISQLPPDALQAFQQAGIDPHMLFSTQSMLGISGLCCGVSIVIALALGALGGLIFAASKPQ